MNRIKITLPETFHFSTEMVIRITDLNYGGHVGNDVFLSLMHEARQQYLLSLGYKELSFAGVGLIMADVALEYKRELNHTDRVRIAVVAADLDKLGFDLFYKVELFTDDGWVLAARAKTGMICYDYATKKKVSIPEEAIAKLTHQ